MYLVVKRISRKFFNVRNPWPLICTLYLSYNKWKENRSWKRVGDTWAKHGIGPYINLDSGMSRYLWEFYDDSHVVRAQITYDIASYNLISLKYWKPNNID